VSLIRINNIPWDQIAFPSVEFFLRRYVIDYKNGMSFAFHSNYVIKNSEIIL